MSAGDYLKRAAGELRNAADYMQRQASQLLADETRVESSKKSEISKKQNDLAADQAVIGSSVIGDSEKVRIELETNELYRQIDKKKHEITEVKKSFTSEANEMQHSAQELLNKSRELERMAGDPRFSK